MHVIILLLWLHYQLVLLVKVHLCIVLRYVAGLVLLLLYFLVIVYIYVPSCCFGGALNRCGTVELINTVCCSMSICFYKFDVSYIPIVLYLHVLHHH